MADITALILADHNWFREQFAKLDALQAQSPEDRTALERVWRPLADKLDVHAYIEEKIFYPQLSSGAPTTLRARRWMPSATTTRFATECAPPTRPGSAPTSGGRRSETPGWPTTITWARRSEKVCRTSAAMPHSGFA